MKQNLKIDKNTVVEVCSQEQVDKVREIAGIEQKRIYWGQTAMAIRLFASDIKDFNDEGPYIGLLKMYTDSGFKSVSFEDFVRLHTEAPVSQPVMIPLDDVLQILRELKEEGNHLVLTAIKVFEQSRDFYAQKQQLQVDRLAAAEDGYVTPVDRAGREDWPQFGKEEI